MIPNITSYFGTSASEENAAKVITIGNTHFYYSFETVMAVKHNDVLTVMVNMYGPSTGKHLRAIDGGSDEAKAKRLEQADFNAFLKTIDIKVDILP